MIKKLTILTLVGALLLSLDLYTALSAEKLKFGTSSRLFPYYYLPVLMAEDRGFWKESGLELEFIPFRGGTPLYKAVASGDIKMGIASASSTLHAASAGIPLLIVAQVTSAPSFYMWVRGDSPMKEPKDLKGAKIGVTGLGSLTHIFAQAVTRALGVEKDVKVVATGGIPETTAAMKAGVVNATPLDAFQYMELELKGEMRKLLRVDDYLSREWMETAVFAEKDFALKNPDIVRGAVKAIVKSIDFIQNNPTQTMDRMKAESKFSEEGARRAYGILTLNKGAKIDRKGLENVLSFLIEYGLIKKEKAIPVDEAHSPRFLP